MSAEDPGPLSLCQSPMPPSLPPLTKLSWLAILFYSQEASTYHQHQCQSPPGHQLCPLLFARCSSFLLRGFGSWQIKCADWKQIFNLCHILDVPLASEPRLPVWKQLSPSSSSHLLQFLHIAVQYILVICSLASLLSASVLTA